MGALTRVVIVSGSVLGVLLLMLTTASLALGRLLPSKGFIVYTALHNDGTSALRLRDVERDLLVTRPLSLNGTVTNYSPDLRYVVYQSATRYPDPSSTHILDLNTGSAVLVASFPVSLEWSTDRWIYSDGESLYQLDANGSGAAPLYTGGLVASRSVRTSPDYQQRVIEGAEEFGVGWRLYTLPADIPDEQARLLSGTLISAVDPAYSPDGRWIAFIGSAATHSTDALWIVRPDGAEQRLLLRSSGGLYRLRWSPDSRMIALEGEINSDSTSEVALIELATGRIQRYLQIRLVEWSPDGQSLLYIQDTHPCFFSLMTHRSRCFPDGLNGLMMRWMP